MKLIDLIELLFRPLPVQFEPVPWDGPMPERWLRDHWVNRVWAGPKDCIVPIKEQIVMFRYSDGFVEAVGPARSASADSRAMSTYRGIFPGVL